MAISLVQTATNGVFSSSITATFGSDITAGNTLIIFILTPGVTNTITSISGNSNTYNSILSANSFGPEFFLYGVNNANSGPTTITVNLSATATITIIAREYSGLTNSTIDANSSHWGSGTSGTSNASGTTTQANELVIGCFGESVNGGSMSLGSGFSNLATVNGSTQILAGMEDKIVAATGTQTATMTVNGGGQWGGVVATFKASITGDLSVNVSDSLTLSESVVLLDTDNVNTTDSTTLSESTGSYSDLVVTRESINVVISASSDLTISVSDTVNTSENTQLLDTDNVIASDSTTISESIKLLITSSVSVSDSTTLAENVQLAEVDNIVVSDNTTLTESVVMLSTENINVSDSVTLTENRVLLIPTLLVSVLDSSTLTESILLLDSDGIGVLDSVTSTENTQLLVTSFINVSDSTTLTESVQLSESITRAVSDTINTSESVQVQIGAFGDDAISVSDTVGTSEVIQLLVTNRISTSDSITLTESTHIEVNSFINKSDSITLSESIKLAEVDNITVSDSAIITESVLFFTGTINLAVSDTVATSENVQPYAAISFIDVEAVTLIIQDAIGLPLVIPDSITINAIVD